jgi:outer membrane protein assembly factor BamB
MRACRILLTLAVARMTWAAADWPRFRGPNGAGIADTTELPTEFGPERNVIWHTALPPGFSSPVLAGDHVFLTATDGSNLLTYSINRSTGKIEWQREAPRPRKTTKNAPPDVGRNAAASASPATDSANVYVFFEDFGLISYGPDGQERWRVPLGPFNAPYGMASSPILADGKLLQLCDQDTNSFLIAVDPNDGHTLWKAERPEATHGFSTPVIYHPPQGPAQVIVSRSYQVVAYSLDTGDKLWWVRGMAWQAKSVPIMDGDRLYVHSSMVSTSELGLHKQPPFEQMLKEHDANHDGKLTKEEVADEELKKLWFLFDLDQDGYLNEREWNNLRARDDAGNALFAIRLGGTGDTTGNVLWRFEKSLPNIPSPVLYKGVLYVLREGGVMTALDPANGKVLKQGRIEGALDTYYSSPVAAADKIYTLSNDCKMAVLEAGRDWKVLAVNDLKGECWATPAIADGRLYVRTQEELYCFSSFRLASRPMP